MIFLPCSKTEKWDEIQKACERDEKLLQLKQQVGNAGDANSKIHQLKGNGSYFLKCSISGKSSQSDSTLFINGIIKIKNVYEISF